MKDPLGSALSRLADDLDTIGSDLVQQHYANKVPGLQFVERLTKIRDALRSHTPSEKREWFTRDEIEEIRSHLKTYFPNQSVERSSFNKICDLAVKSLKDTVSEKPACKRCDYPNCYCEVKEANVPA